MEDLYVVLNGSETGENNRSFTIDYDLIGIEGNFLPFMFSKSEWVPHVGAGLAYVLIIQNIIIIRIFLKRDLLSAVSIILSVLALSDTLSVFFWFVPEHVGALFNYFNGSSFGEYSTVTASHETYPFCVFAYWSRNILSTGFHSTAIVLTTILGIQKTVVLLFPVFSKANLNKKWATVSTACILSLCLGLEIPYAYYFSFMPVKGVGCIKRLLLDPVSARTFYDFSHYFRSGLLIIAILIQLVTTMFITSKLTCLRRTLWTDSKSVRRRNRRSTVIIIYVTVIFIVSEFPSVLVSLCLELRTAKHFTSFALQYLPLIISIGCFLNFWLYLIMSQRFRRELNIVRSSRRRPRSSFIVI